MSCPAPCLELPCLDFNCISLLCHALPPAWRRHVLSYAAIGRALPCLVIPCIVLPFFEFSCLPYLTCLDCCLDCLALPCLALPCLALPCLALNCLELPCPALHCPFLFYASLPCLTLPCLAMLVIDLRCPALSNRSIFSDEMIICLRWGKIMEHISNTKKLTGQKLILTQPYIEKPQTVTVWGFAAGFCCLYAGIRTIIEFIFQQVYALSHTCHVTKTWLRQKRIGCLDWAPKSPNFNRIENVCCLMKNRIIKIYRIPHSRVISKCEKQLAQFAAHLWCISCPLNAKNLL